MIKIPVNRSTSLRAMAPGLMFIGLALILSLAHATSGASAEAGATQGAVVPDGGPYAIRQRYVLGGPGGWDYLTVDPKTNRLYISRATRVMVMSTLDGSIVGTIPDTQGVHGIALAPDLGKGFTSNGRADTVTVVDLESLKPQAVIAVGANPDAILYDAATKHVYTFNGRSHDISIIDPSKGAVVATIAAGGKPEFAVSDGAGRIFFNIEDTAQLGVIDSVGARRIAAWPLAACEEPSGLAIDAAHKRLFSVCANSIMVVTDAVSGRRVAEVPIGRGPDAAAYDAERGLVFSSNGQDGTLTVIRQIDPDHYSVVINVPTRKGARTMALDPKNHRAYLVTAEFGAKPAPTAAEPNPRAPVVDGTFEVLVLGD